MIIKNGFLKQYLLGIACLLSFSNTLAQTRQEVLRSLQGSWMLEHVSIHELNDTVQIDSESVAEIEIYPQLDIVGDELSFTYQGTVQKKKFEIAGDLLYLNFREISFYSEWMMENGKLYIRWGQDIPDVSNEDDVRLLSVMLIYKRR